ATNRLYGAIGRVVVSLENGPISAVNGKSRTIEDEAKPHREFLGSFAGFNWAPVLDDFAAAVTLECDRRIGLPTALPPDQPSPVKSRPTAISVAMKRHRSSAIDTAIGLLSKHPDWTDEMIANEAGCSGSNLSQNKRYKSAREAVRGVTKENL